LLAHKPLGVIFDLDNTLVSSSLDFDSIRASLGCPKGIDLLDFIDALPEHHQVEAHEVIVEYEINDALTANKLVGTDQILTLLAELSLPCAIVTRNCRQAATIKVKNNNIDIEILLTREDHKAKPAPDALLHLAELWQIAPENLLYVGDYLYDLQAARNANTMSCLINYGITASYENLADVVVLDLNELSETIKQVSIVEHA
jgi:HAD superfamily hydrolase (TIGR01549 family)